MQGLTEELALLLLLATLVTLRGGAAGRGLRRLEVPARQRAQHLLLGGPARARHEPEHAHLVRVRVGVRVRVRQSARTESGAYPL